MCGLVSIVSKQKNGFFNSDVKVFTEMLFADQLRGAHGTGIIYNQGNKIKTLKAPVASSDFVNDKAYNKAESEIFQHARFVVGHNRAATIGKLTHQNTHPFRCDHITLVHNGTLTSHKELADTESDSMAICHAIAKIGFKETVKKIKGAFALIWYDEKQKTLNFTRNYQRPLYIVETIDLFCFVSEPKLAEWILERNNQTVTKVTNTDVHTLYQFEASDWTKYETEKYVVSTYSSSPPWHPHGYTPQTSPATTSRSGSPSNSMIGRDVIFIPVEIDKNQPEKLIGEYEDKVSGEIIECKFWAESPKKAQELLEQGKNGHLRGYVSHTGWQPANKGEFFILRNVYAPKILQLPVKEEKGTVTTFNEKKLTPQEAEQVSKKSCLYCNGVIGNLLSACEIWEDDGELNGLCPDCTDWSYRNAQKVN